MGLFNRFSKYVRVKFSGTYKNIMQSTDKVAVASLTLFIDKTDADKKQIMTDARALANRMFDAIKNESDLVRVLSVLTAIQIVVLTVPQLPDELGRTPPLD